MPDKRGLIFCQSQFSTNPFCIVSSKLIQLILSMCLLLVIIYDMVNRYKYQKDFVNLFYGLCVLMMAALICNIGFCLNHKILAFNYLEGFFYNIYFVSIVYYVAYKLLHVMQLKRIYLWVLHTAYGVTIVFLISVLIQKFVLVQSSCEQLWYLVISGLSICLSIILTVIGATYTRTQISKLSGIENPTHYKNPLPNIWIWISINIFSQLCSFVQSITFQLRPTSHCTFSDNFGVDQAVKLLFVIFSFHLGMISTIIFFRNKYKSQKENITMSAQSDGKHTRRASVNIQLIQDFSASS